ncbi:hypothetical protein [Brachyspira pilosicoli]|uniref:hypothetical protein n=1 Tax=Brachyspira pilosicoli TaxID=52584 RepID=UPI001CA55E78|nr:hypothetical protein [Brachyspira pilosicoli]MBW5396374.1 hypothetical protein [Brachyspira pilosicoli]
MNNDIYDYINKWVGNTTVYPRYKIDKALDFVTNIINNNNVSIIATGAKRNNTNVSYMEYLNLFLIADSNSKDTRVFKKDISKILEKENIEYNDILDSLIIVYDKEKIVLRPSFKVEEENKKIEGALITSSDGENNIYYPKLDNKNFDKKEYECKDNFINLIRIFKYIFQSFNGEIKELNEFNYELIEALVWNIPNEYFNFKDYDDGLLKSISYLYDKISSEDYIELSEINDIKVLFSTKNNINRKNVLIALYKLRKYIEENM